MDDSERPRQRRPRLVLVYVGDLDSTEIEDADGSGKPTSLLGKVDHFVADDLLIALRTIFTLTYSKDTSLASLEKTVREIRHATVGALRGLGPMLKTLRLKPLGPGELPADDSPGWLDRAMDRCHGGDDREAKEL